MSNAMTASQLLDDLRSLPETERSRFFLLLASRAFGGEDLSYEQVFGHLAGELFTASEAAGIGAAPGLRRQSSDARDGIIRQYDLKTGHRDSLMC